MCSAHPILIRSRCANNQIFSFCTMEVYSGFCCQTPLGKVLHDTANCPNPGYVIHCLTDIWAQLPLPLPLFHTLWTVSRTRGLLYAYFYKYLLSLWINNTSGFDSWSAQRIYLTTSENLASMKHIWLLFLLQKQIVYNYVRDISFQVVKHPVRLTLLWEYHL